jgi:hypothetical protein
MQIGQYIYGFTRGDFLLEDGLRGLLRAPVRTIKYGELAVIVSDHPVQRLAPIRINLEPHHRVLRQISRAGSVVPVAFGHICGSVEELLHLVGENYTEIDSELSRLTGKVEMGVKLRWAVENIFEFFVRTDPSLREMRDRIFGQKQPTFEEKLGVGALFEKRLHGERERLTETLSNVLAGVTCDRRLMPAGEERIICSMALLVEKSRAHEFAAALEAAAALFNSDFALEYDGPWPPYSFVHLRLRTSNGAQARGA